MPVKKATRVKKPARGKKPTGLTSALGPKATTMVVVLVMAGGIMVAARQQQTRAREALAEASRADVVLAAEPAAEPAAKKKKAVASVASDSTTGGPSSASPAAPEVTVSAKTPAAVTVTGCLERTGEGFRMKDTGGADAPKARSWKSGFLKKGSTPVDVVDPAHGLQLADYVGGRVSVTGTLVDREMRARSLRRIGSCKAN